MMVILIVLKTLCRKAGEEVAKDTPEEEIKLTKTFAAYMDDNQVKIIQLQIVLYMTDQLKLNK